MVLLKKAVDYARTAKELIRKKYAHFYVSFLNCYPKKSNPVFSVVIPIYDRTDVVRLAIESVLNQSFKNFELILVCDGSPPETRGVVSEFVDNPQVKIYSFSEKSGNACRGRNHGILKAKGMFVAFLDSDDIATPYRLERSLFHLIYRGVDLVGGAYECLVEKGAGQNVRNGQIGYSSDVCTYEALLEQNMLGICTVAVKRDLLLSWGGFREEMRYREDHELWLRLARNGCTIYNAPEIFAQYRVHSDNAEKNYLADDAYWFSMALTEHKRKYTWS